MALTTYAKNRLLANIVGRNYNAFGTLFLGLSRTAPNDRGGNVSEPDAGKGYERVLLGTYGSADTYKMSDPENGISHNTSAILFPRATADWTTGDEKIRYVLFYGSRTGTDLIGYTALSTPKEVQENFVANFDVGAITLSVTDEDDNN